MKYPGRISAHSQGKEHVAELAYSRIRYDPLNISLDKGYGSREYGGHAPDYSYSVHGSYRKVKERVAARDQKDTGCNHGGGMDQRGYRRWAFHCIRQPYMERYLGRFADCTAEKQQGYNSRQADFPPQNINRLSGNTACLTENLQILKASECKEDKYHTKTEPEVSEPVNNKSLLSCISRRLLVKPVTDKEI